MLWRQIATGHCDLAKWNFPLRRGLKCPYVVLAMYFLQTPGHAASSLVLSSLREHDHSSAQNSGKIFTVAQAAAAKQFFSDGGHLPRDLLGFLNSRYLNSTLDAENSERGCSPGLCLVEFFLSRQKKVPFPDVCE